MPRYFTQYWSAAQCADDAPFAGHLIEYTAGKGFRKRGITAGDVIYAVTMRRGRLFLIGRLTVREVIGELEAVRLLGADNLVDGADEYVVASSATPMHFHIEVPCDVTEQLLFVARLTASRCILPSRAFSIDRRFALPVSSKKHQPRCSISSCHRRNQLTAPRMTSNQALQPTATRCAFSFFITRTVPEIFSLAPGSRG